ALPMSSLRAIATFRTLTPTLVVGLARDEAIYLKLPSRVALFMLGRAASSGHLHNIPLVRNRSNSLGAHTRVYRQSCGYVSPAGSALPWPCAQGDATASKREYLAPSGYLRPKPHHGQL